MDEINEQSEELKDEYFMKGRCLDCGNVGLVSKFSIQCKDCIKKEKIKDNKPIEKKEKKPERLYEPITEDQFLQIIKYCRNKKQTKYIIIFLLQFGSGLRINEVLNLEKEDIRLKERKVFIKQGKGKKDGYSILDKSFKTEFLDYIPLRNKKGKKLTKTGVQKIFTKITLELGINKIIGTYKLRSGKERDIYKYHTHSLRHGFANKLLSKGVPLNVVQSLMRHKHISTTNRYTQIGGDAAIQIAIEKGM